MNRSTQHSFQRSSMKSGFTFTRATFALCATTLVFVATAQAADTDKPEDYSLRYSLQTRADAGLQRLVLPEAALVALRAGDRADIRVFNAAGQAVPLAIAPVRPVVQAATASRWPLYPINATASEQTNIGGMQLRIEERAGQRTVRVDTGSAAKSAAATTQQIGALVDTTTLSAALDNLLVDADFAVGQPVPLTIAASKDLKSWRTLVDSVPVVRFGSEGAPSSLSVSLAGAKIEKEYLRITWPTQQSFTLRGVQITPASAITNTPRAALPLIVTAPQGSGELVISVPFATPIQSLEIRASTPNALVPVRISGRSQRSEPWRSIASSVIYRVSSGSTETFNPNVELGGASVRELRIEPDRSTPGFGAAPPAVKAMVDPIEIVFVASGAAPFALAVGRADAKRIALPIVSLIPGYTQDAERALPLASVNLASAVAVIPPTTVLSDVREKIGAPSDRSLLLWLVLLGGVALLGGIAWVIFRQTKTGLSNEPKSDV